MRHAVIRVHFSDVTKTCGGVPDSSTKALNSKLVYAIDHAERWRSNGKINRRLPRLHC